MARVWRREEEALSADELLARQLAALQRQATYAAGSSPYYRELLADVDLSTPFADLDDLAARVPPIVKDTIVARQRAEPPYGGMLAAPEEAIARHYVYPNGQVLAWTGRDQRWFEEMYATGLYTAGVRPEDRVDLTFQFGWVTAGTIWDAGVRRLGAAAAPGGAGDSARHAANMRLLRTTCIVGFPTFLERIGHAASEQGIDPARELSVRKLVIVGEWHGDDTKERLSSLYGGASVREAYGTGEAGLVAAECEADPEAMHVHPDVLVEVRDERTGELVGPGEGGELYLTPLAVEGIPVLRYRTGDLTGRLELGPCECGRRTPRIGRIVGRVGQMLRVKGLFLSKALVEAALTDVDERLAKSAFQMVVDRPRGQDRLRLLVENPGEVAADACPRVVARLQERASLTAEVELVAPGELGEVELWYADQRSNGA